VVVATLITSVASADTHLEYVVRGGASWLSTQTNLGRAPAGTAPVLESEIGGRSPNIAISGFVSFYTLRENLDANDQDTDLQTRARYYVADLGWRATLYGAGKLSPYMGVGLADETVFEYGKASSCYCENPYCSVCTPQYDHKPYTQWSSTMLFEVHLGATVHHVDLMVLFGYGTNPDDHDYGLRTTRVMAGARF